MYATLVNTPITMSATRSEMRRLIEDASDHFATVWRRCRANAVSLEAIRSLKLLPMLTLRRCPPVGRHGHTL
jgi:hypothetical protein